MTMPKATDDDIAWFDELLPDAPGVTRRPMFGNLGGFVDGQMFLALLGDRVAVRLDATSREELLGIDGTARFEPLPGRPMTEYVVLPEAWKDDTGAAGTWIDRSMAYAARLQAEQTRRRARRVRKRATRRRTAERTSRDATTDTTGSPAPAAGGEPGAAGLALPSVNGSTPRPVNAETPGRARRAAKARAAARRTTTRSAGRARRSGG